MSESSAHFLREASVFHGLIPPESGYIVGYAAIMEALHLKLPLPRTISLISTKNRKYRNDGWNVFTPKHQPEDTLYKQLVFALKYEGVNLLFFKKLFLKLSRSQVVEILQQEPTGQYSRKIWFLYEWLLDIRLPIPDSDVKTKYIPLLDDKTQFTVKGVKSARHKVINNLPGSKGFCPLIYKTKKLLHFLELNLSNQTRHNLQNTPKDLLQRTSAFLLLKDSKASFTIEGESPKSKRAARWGQAIGQAGSKPLSAEELVRLQQLVIENTRFTKMGFRKQGGFVGEHDRVTGEPIPDHISARWQDVEPLVDGLIETTELLEKSEFDAVLAAAIVSFGFVFIHPFVDGNGRIHRYLIHHILTRKKFAQQGIIFPVSASILDHIDDYRRVLELYSHPLLDLIDWKVTANNNVEVLNDTIDYYRYFDATAQAEFLFDCVADTIENIIPNEVTYLQHYDEFKRYLDDEFEMPDKLVALLIRFLEQGNGRLSKRARQKEFSKLSDKEVKAIETQYQEIFDER